LFALLAGPECPVVAGRRGALSSVFLSHQDTSKESNVSKYALKDLIELWEAEKISLEQAIGQILLWLQELQQQIYDLEKRGARGERQEAGGEGGE